jgi:membrane protein
MRASHRRSNDEIRKRPASLSEKFLTHKVNPKLQETALNRAKQEKARRWKSLGISMFAGWMFGRLTRRHADRKHNSNSDDQYVHSVSSRESGRLLAGLRKQVVLSGLGAIACEALQGGLSQPPSEQEPGANPVITTGAEQNRGREAERPSEIPRSGWRDIFLRVKSEMAHDNLSIVAAGVAFYGFLAIFPAIAALVSIYGLITSPAEVERHLEGLEAVLPPEAAGVINDQLRRIVGAQQSGLGWGALAATILALWSAASGMGTMITAMNIAYDEEEKRSFIKLKALALLLTVAAIFLVIAFLGLVVGVPVVLETVGIGMMADPLINYLRWPVLALSGVMALQVLYRYGPSRNQAQWHWVSWGAVIGTTLWLISSALFSFYVGNFASYNATYGSLGVIVILMMWFFFSVYSILLGAEINAEMEHQTAKDTTVGKPKPLGSRQAYVADTVGARQ